MPIAVLVALLGLMGTMGGVVMNNQTQRMSLDQNMLLALMSSKDTSEGLLIYFMLKGGLQNSNSLNNVVPSTSLVPNDLNEQYTNPNTFLSNLTTIFPMFKLFTF